MSTDQEPPGGSALSAPDGMPEGAFLELPKPTEPGEMIPPIPCQFEFGLTPKDSKGHRWAVLQVTDGTVTAKFRIPWQVSGQVGMQIAQGLAAVQAKAASEENGGLVVPGRPAGGGLLVPGRGGPRA